MRSPDSAREPVELRVDKVDDPVPRIISDFYFLPIFLYLNVLSESIGYKVAIAFLFFLSSILGCQERRENLDLPVVETIEASKITQIRTASEGNVIDDGGSWVS